MENNNSLPSTEVVLHESILIAMGFDSSFSSDPQEPNPSKQFKKGNFVVHMPGELEQDFITEDGGLTSEGRACATITLDYIEKYDQWKFEQKWKPHGGRWYQGSGGNFYTTKELIQLFFESLSKRQSGD